MTKNLTANACADVLMALIEQETGDMAESVRERIDRAIDAMQTAAFSEGIDHERMRLVASIRSLAVSISLGLDK